MNQRFRAHHILCTVLYEGKGYSGAFCENMTAVTERLRTNPDEAFILAAEPDLICAHCPNQTENGECSQDHNRVVDKDHRVLANLGLTEGECCSYREMCEHARARITEELFDRLCGTCEWRMQGLCRYEDLTAGLAKICGGCGEPGNEQNES